MKTTLSLNLNKPEIFPESRPTETRPAGKFRAPPATGPRAPPRAAGAPRGANGGRWTHRGRPRPRRRLASAAPREPRAPHVGRTGPAGPTAGDRAPAGASPPPPPGSRGRPTWGERGPLDPPRATAPLPAPRLRRPPGATGSHGRPRMIRGPAAHGGFDRASVPEPLDSGGAFARPASQPKRRRRCAGARAPRIEATGPGPSRWGLR